MVDCADDAWAVAPFTVHMALRPPSRQVFLALAPRLLDDLVAEEMAATGIAVLRGDRPTEVADVRYDVAVVSGEVSPGGATSVVVRLGQHGPFTDVGVVVSSAAGEVHLSVADLHALVALVSQLCASADT